MWTTFKVSSFTNYSILFTNYLLPILRPMCMQPKIHLQRSRRQILCHTTQRTPSHSNQCLQDVEAPRSVALLPIYRIRWRRILTTPRSIEHQCTHNHHLDENDHECVVPCAMCATMDERTSSDLAGTSRAAQRQ